MSVLERGSVVAVPKGSKGDKRFPALVLRTGIRSLRVSFVYLAYAAKPVGWPRAGCACEISADWFFGYAHVIRLHLAAQIVAGRQTGVVIKMLPSRHGKTKFSSDFGYRSDRTFADPICDPGDHCDDRFFLI